MAPRGSDEDVLGRRLHVRRRAAPERIEAPEDRRGAGQGTVGREVKVSRFEGPGDAPAAPGAVESPARRENP